MKKLASIFLIFNLLLCPIFAETIQIDTSKGKTDLVIPETQEELREAYIEMSKLYVEERYAYEDLIEDYEDIEESFGELQTALDNQKASIDIYVKDNELLRSQYETMMKDYDELVKTLDKRNRKKPIQGMLAVELNFVDNFTGTRPAVELGAFLFEKVFVSTRVSYPWEIGIGLGFTF